MDKNNARTFLQSSTSVCTLWRTGGADDITLLLHDSPINHPVSYRMLFQRSKATASAKNRNIICGKRGQLIKIQSSFERALKPLLEKDDSPAGDTGHIHVPSLTSSPRYSPQQHCNFPIYIFLVCMAHPFEMGCQGSPGAPFAEIGGCLFVKSTIENNVAKPRSEPETHILWIERPF